MKWWRIFLILVVVILIFAGVDHWYEKRVQARRDAAYQVTLRRYSEQFRPGTSRKEVEEYFRAKGIAVQQDFGPGSLDAYTDLVLIGKEPAPWYCNALRVYVAFDFAAIAKNAEFELQPRDSDSLQKTHLRRMGESCL